MSAITLETLNENINAVRADLKALTRMVRRVKATQEDPSGEKAKARSANNIFNRLFEPSEQLREFLGMQAGEQTTRKDVTKFISNYVVEHNLKDPESKRVIILDAKLQALLNPPAGLQLTLLNIQKYLNQHYPKKAEEPAKAKEPKAEKPKEAEKPKVAVKKKLEAESSVTSEEPAAKKKKIVVSSATSKGKAVVA